ncbi:NUDIX domain-containing protein [Bowdeniella nasicola]|uniref:NUDIX domain-containing protein n=1 Tax=Bowdeniella nasicola TaxID=208480 RepID=A0A1H3VI36_9ACTO|nr:NUDIX domain-containing protein [Bowdeniella nasicola]SDZ74429.1 NUDIX domain-containing protein [Bowdeniella nasicola]
MPHIFTMPGGHDQTVSAFIFRPSTREILLHRHRRFRSLLQPGGHIEPIENPWQALIREVKEETGYRARQLRVLQPGPPPQIELPGFTVHPLPALVNTHQISGDHFHSDLAYALLADGEPAGAPAEGESEELRWLTLEQWAATEPVVDNALATARYIAELMDHWQPIDVDAFSRSTSRAD